MKINGFPTNIHFQYAWRAYQSRILEQLDVYATNHKIHLVAPPGSGKTVLGLEIARRFNRPTLILAPTITIRNQWVERLQYDFNQGKLPLWVSTNIKSPQWLTVCTYQALHAAFKSPDINLAHTLYQAHIETVILDECHHLQKAWWKSLTSTLRHLSATIVALTATPPFDANTSEWERYYQLCGEVDAKIDVPALVAAKNLCPHQDYIYVSTPTQEEQMNINTIRRNIDNFLEHLQLNLPFKDILKAHPFINSPEAHLEAIYANPSYFSAIIILLNYLGRVLPAPAIGIIGADETDIPPLNDEWLDLFWNSALHDSYFQNFEEDPAFQTVITTLKQTDCFQRGRTCFTNGNKIDKTLRSSKGKLQSIIKIVETEYESQKETLRMVILSDFIRKEYLPKNDLEQHDSYPMGVVPIFEILRQRFPVAIELGVLTGSLVIIPQYSLSLFKQIIKENNLFIDDFIFKPLAHDADYLSIKSKTATQNQLVSLITKLFQRGGITVLVGTKSLLGEGWDAPAINALVLATVVGSFVLSNQMRGRAIRTIATNTQKTANIWHLVCIDPKTTDGGHDLKILQRRFRAFHGLNFAANPTIENGIQRLELPRLPLNKQDLDHSNATMINHAQNRLRLYQDWKNALQKGKQMTETINIPIKKTRRYTKEHKTLKTHALVNISASNVAFMSTLVKIVIVVIAIHVIIVFFGIDWFNIIGFGICYFLIFGLLVNRKQIRQWFDFYKISKNTSYHFTKKRIFYIAVVVWILAAIAILAITSSFPMLISLIGLTILGLLTFSDEFTTPSIKAWNQYTDHDKADFIVLQIGKVILQTLAATQELRTPISQLQLSLKTQADGNIICLLKNANSKETHLFMDSMQEIMNPIDNPRYLLQVTSLTQNDKNAKIYYAVPSIFGKKKADAALFASQWCTLVGNAELVFTRNINGRHLLLKARGQSFALDSHPEAVRLNVWK